MWFHFNEVSRIEDFTEVERVVEVRGTRGTGGRGNRKLLFDGYKVSVWGNENILEWVLVIVTHNPVKNTYFFFFIVHGGLQLISPAFPFPIAEISMSTFWLRLIKILGIIEISLFLKLSFLNSSFYIYISEYGFLRSSLTYNICSTVFEKPETECVPTAP